MSELQVNRCSTAKSSFALRDLFRWCNRYTYANEELMEDDLYDWGQYLIDGGYFHLHANTSLATMAILQDRKISIGL